MKIFQLAILTILGSCLAQAEQYPSVYDILGRYTYADGERTLEITEGDSGLRYSWTIKTTTIGKTMGPTSAVEFGDNWFFFIESEDRVWFYNGKSDLVLLQSSYVGGGAYSINVAGDWLKKQVPLKLAIRLPQEMKDKIMSRKTQSTELDNVIATQNEKIREAQARLASAQTQAQPQSEIDRAERDVRVQESILKSMKERIEKDLERSKQ